jgi:uncharacterized protein
MIKTSYQRFFKLDDDAVAGMTLHLEKKAIRVLGIAESFKKSEKYSDVAGIVVRSDLVVDGFVLGQIEVSGSDATKEIVKLIQKLGRNDVNAIMISGSVLSLYNILDVDQIYSASKIPVLALSFSRSASDLAANIRFRFPKRIAEKKIELLEKLGESVPIKLRTGYTVFLRSAGVNEAVAKKLLDKFTLQGAVPEPVRVARLLAKTIATFPSK